MIGDFVIDISFIVGGPVKLGEFGALGGGLLAKRLLVLLSSDVTFSFFANASAFSFTAV